MKRKATVMKTLLILVILIAAAALTGGCYLAGITMTGDRQTLEEARKWQDEHYDTSFYDSSEKEEYTVEGDGGYILHVRLVKCSEDSGKYVIISHGYTDNRLGSLKYRKMYQDIGYNCVIYDLRGHGLNERTFTTYGVLEGKDLARLIDDTRERYPDLKVLGLHGESLGAATTVTCLKYSPKVDFAVADCGFSDIENVLKNGYRNAKVPVFLEDLASIGALLRYHYRLNSMRPIDSLKGNTVPVLFIHGEDDPFILPENSVDMYDAATSVKDLHLIAGAQHAESILVAPEEYARTVEAFLDRLEIY